MKIRKLDWVSPSEDNRYCCFEGALEKCESVYFHATHSKNFELICEHGFLSKSELIERVLIDTQEGSDPLNSVSYAYNSGQCIGHAKTNGFLSNCIIFAVKFNSLKNIKYTPDGNVCIHVFGSAQPCEVLGYSEVPSHYQHS